MSYYCDKLRYVCPKHPIYIWEEGVSQIWKGKANETKNLYMKQICHLVVHFSYAYFSKLYPDIQIKHTQV